MHNTKHDLNISTHTEQFILKIENNIALHDEKVCKKPKHRINYFSHDVPLLTHFGRIEL